MYSRQGSEDPRVVMDVMGWSDQRMLLRYQHVVDELRRDAATRMGSARGQLPTTVTPSEATARTTQEQSRR